MEMIFLKETNFILNELVRRNINPEIIDNYDSTNVATGGFGKGSHFDLHFTPPIKKSEIETFKTLNCFKFIKEFYCKRINSFSYKIFSIKRATLQENNFFDEKKENKNIVNAKFYTSTNDVLKQMPISLIKGYFMPVLFNPNKLIFFISVFKLIGSFLLLYCCYFIYKNRPIQDFLIVSGIIIMFSPLIAATDIVTSNYFTYLRYIYPFNVYLILILFSFMINQTLKIKND